MLRKETKEFTFKKRPIDGKMACVFTEDMFRILQEEAVGASLRLLFEEIQGEGETFQITERKTGTVPGGMRRYSIAGSNEDLIRFSELIKKMNASPGVTP